MHYGKYICYSKEKNMYYDHNIGQSLKTSNDDLFGYYAVFILQHGQYVRHVIKANSNLDAALKVKDMTGILPSSEKDVVGPLASSSHGYDKQTRDMWLNA